jgi:hypothetical protein
VPIWSGAFAFQTASSRMVSRREFVGWLATVVPAGLIVRHAHAESIAYLAAAPATLDALGVAVLPSELGATQIARVVSGFRRWMDGYREGAEVNHAYGNSRLRFTGATPATRWTQQLDDLDAAAQSTHRRAFSALTVAERQALVRPLIAGERGIPGTPDGGAHVAVALLGFFYSSSEANDLCYDAAIGKSTCRPLNESSRRPLARGGTRGGRMLPLRNDVEVGS